MGLPSLPQTPLPSRSHHQGTVRPIAHREKDDGDDDGDASHVDRATPSPLPLPSPVRPRARRWGPPVAMSGSQEVRERRRRRVAMACEGDEWSWICGAATVNLHRVGTIVREIGEPCIHRSPSKGSRMLKPDKWDSIFDSDGKAVSFQKALKLITLGGVDPSIRPVVWEFLLGCYTFSSTAEYRRQLRMARRERYEDLIKECQRMHSSIGTGTLAYAVGSKVMDVRTLSKEIDVCEENRAESPQIDDRETYAQCQPESFESDVRRGTGGEARDSDAHGNPSTKSTGDDETLSPIETFFDFPPLPVTNLFENRNLEGEEVIGHTSSSEQASRHAEKTMHSFQINNNVDLIMESSDRLSVGVSCINNGKAGNINVVQDLQDWKSDDKVLNRLEVSDVPESSGLGVSTNYVANRGDRVSEWLWTLHQIVVDVVRTDSHLEFYEDSKNIARMSDILAVYAWVDPSTGYCQGMSDLLSPFVVLYEDDADAFWCFEMLLRRLRENFQMEGPVGVMKQLQALWKILELTDTEIFTHLSAIGAESLHFAFRMLLVLFRRELPFNDALCMWEMMWAADFDEAVALELHENCLEPLVLHIPRISDAEMATDNSKTMVDSSFNGKNSLKGPRCEYSNGGTPAPHQNGAKPDPSHPFCGLTKATFWARHNQMQLCMSAATRDNDDELPVFCVAAILITNRQKIMRETSSFDDLIKMFNDNKLKINVRRCIRMAVKLRKKYFYKQISGQESI